MIKRLRVLCLAFLAVEILLAGPADETSAIVRFRAVDIYIDLKQNTLGAYQLEWASKNPGARIVGIEGGESLAFRQPPYYDPKAIQHQRVILAAFSTAKAEKLPKGKTRVATIHLQMTGERAIEPVIKNARAATPEGTTLTGEATSIERKTE